MQDNRVATVYPTFRISQGGVIFPDVNLPRNFRELVPGFYAQKRNEDVTKYTQMLQGLIAKGGEGLDIQLKWDNKSGLTNILFEVHGGLDLVVSQGWPRFREYDLGLPNIFYAGAIAMKYVSELLKSGVARR